MSAPAVLSPGSIFAGDYRVESRLSEGGMGAVYVVAQLSTGQRRALKVMHAALTQAPGFRERFAREARVGASIKSEHVVHVLASGVDDASGTPWLVMELLEGEDLGARLERGPMAPADVLTVFTQLCHALARAHEVGVVHRDLKPENVFLAVSQRADSMHTVKVLDFGIAKIAAEAHTANTSAIGTPLYMAPEQTEVGKPITPATDVWALGLIAFRMLTGRSYWKSGNVASASPATLLREIVFEPVVPASERARELGVRTALPAGFDAWFERTVNRTPTERFANAAEAYAALVPCLGDASRTPALLTLASEGAPERASTGPTPVGVEIDHETDQLERTLTAPSRRPAVLVLAIVALGIGGGAWFMVRGHKAPAPAASEPVIEGRCPRDTVLVTGGEFRLGDNLAQSSVQPFCLDLTEVTAAAYGACVDNHRCSSEGLACSPAATFGQAQKASHPINCVTFYQALAYCEARGARLPTEAEWEWAARGEQRAFGYPWGNDEPGLRACWSGLEKRDSTCPVGSFPNGDTLTHVRDLAGNVVEWTSSRYDATTDQRVYRGGSFADTEPGPLRAASRARTGPSQRGERLGFRCVTDPS